MESRNSLQRQAAEMIESGELPSHIAVEKPAPMPKPTGDIAQDVAAYYGVESAEEEIRIAYSENQLRLLAQTALSLGGGLTPEGKLKWIFPWLLEEDSLDASLEDAFKRADQYKSSIAT